MADITVIILFLLALSAAPEVGRLFPPVAPRWAGRAWWRNNAFRPPETRSTETPSPETPRPRLRSSGAEQAAAESHDVCRPGDDA